MDDTRGKDALLAEIQTTGTAIKGNAICCFLCEDKRPSAGLFKGKDGAWRYKCHKCGFCGDIFDIRAKITGRSLAEILREESPNPTNVNTPPKAKGKRFGRLEDITLQGGQLEAIHENRNPETGRVDIASIRYRTASGKSFLLAHQNGEGFVIGAPEGLWPLYGREYLNGRAVIVEGEKCADCLNAIGVPAVTSHGGAKNPHRTDWTLLAGKTVYLWPDNDAVGLDYASRVVSILGGLNPKPKIYQLNPAKLGLEPKDDCFDVLAGVEGTQEKAEAAEYILELAEPIETGPAAELSSLHKAIIAGEYSAIDFPWQNLSALTQALLPGTVLLICGDPGSTKSFFLLEACAYWYEQGIRLALYELEETRAYHLNRALAQRIKNSQLLKPDWVRENPLLTKQALETNRDFLEGFGRTIFDAPDNQMTIDGLANWAEDSAKDGCRIIAADPVTMLQQARDTWLQDSALMERMKTIARQYACSIILVTHPKKGRKKAVGLDELAGGTAYTRFSQSVLWIQHHSEPQTSSVWTPCGRETITHNKTISILKSRNAPGAGKKLAFEFCGDSFCLQEKGIILKET